MNSISKKLTIVKNKMPKIGFNKPQIKMILSHRLPSSKINHHTCKRIVNRVGKMIGIRCHRKVSLISHSKN